MNTPPTANEIASRIAARMPVDPTYHCGEMPIEPKVSRALMEAAKRDGQALNNRKAKGTLANGLVWELFYYSESVYETSMTFWFGKPSEVNV